MDDVLRNLAPVVGILSVGLAGLAYARWVSRQTAGTGETADRSGQPAE